MNTLRNKVQLIGNLGNDPEITNFESGKTLAKFAIATNESYKNAQGEKIQNTEWHNVVVRNKAAEICEKYLSKGDKVYIEGRIKTRKWQDDSGNDRYSTEIQCNDFTFLTTKKENETGNITASTAPNPQAAKPQESGPKVNEGNDDLPF